VPVFLTAVLTGSLWLAMAGFSGQIVLHMFINTPGYAMMMDSVSSNLRGGTAAVLQVSSNLLGFGIGPMVGGALSDALHPHFGDQSLRYALAIFCVVSLWPCAHLLRAAALTDRSRRLAALEPAARGA